MLNANGNSSSSAATVVKSPRNACEGVGIPQSRRAMRLSPWSQIVHRESEPITNVQSSPSEAAMEQAIAGGAAGGGGGPSSSPPLGFESSESGIGLNGNMSKHKPSNEAVEDEAWPELAVSARPSNKSSSESPIIT